MPRRTDPHEEEERRLRQLGPGEGRVAPEAYEPGVATELPGLPGGGDAEVALAEAPFAHYGRQPLGPEAEGRRAKERI